MQGLTLDVDSWLSNSFVLSITAPGISPQGPFPITCWYWDGLNFGTLSWLAMIEAPVPVITGVQISDTSGNTLSTFPIGGQAIITLSGTNLGQQFDSYGNIVGSLLLCSAPGVCPGSGLTLLSINWWSDNGQQYGSQINALVSADASVTGPFLRCGEHLILEWVSTAIEGRGGTSCGVRIDALPGVGSEGEYTNVQSGECDREPGFWLAVFGWQRWDCERRGRHYDLVRHHGCQRYRHGDDLGAGALPAQSVLVTPRIGWQTQPAQPAQVQDGTLTWTGNTPTPLPSPPANGQPIGSSHISLQVNYTTSVPIVGGPNSGYQYTTSLTPAQDFYYQWELAADLANPNSTFSKNQCGGTSGGWTFITYANLLNNTVRHESSEIAQSHWVEYASSLGTNNLGTWAETQVATPGTSQQIFLSNFASGLARLGSAITTAAAVEPYPVNDDINGNFQGYTNYAPYTSNDCPQ